MFVCMCKRASPQYMNVCVCLCQCTDTNTHTHTVMHVRHTHRHTFSIYIGAREYTLSHSTQHTLSAHLFEKSSNCEILKEKKTAPIALDLSHTHAHSTVYIHTYSSNSSILNIQEHTKYKLRHTPTHQNTYAHKYQLNVVVLA